MFLNRERELSQLENDFLKPTSSFLLLFGRRKVGKTSLLKEYVKNKEVLYFSCVELLPKILFEKFSSIIADTFNQKLSPSHNFVDFLDSIDQCEIKDKTVIILDDFQNLSKIEKEALQNFYRLWNKKLRYKKIQFILSSCVCSSLPEDKKIYDKSDAKLTLKSLEFKSIKAIIKDVSKDDLMCIYALFGTNINYLKQYDTQKDFMRNVEEIFFNTKSEIFNDGIHLIKNELSEIVTYSSILYAIALGNNKIGDIALCLGVKSSYLTRYIQKLLDLMIISKITPINDDPHHSKFGRYEIEDNYLKFWFGYVYPNLSLINKGEVDFTANLLQTDFIEHMVVPVYKNYIYDLLIQNPENFLSYTPLKIGRWWNNKNKEIDIVAYNSSHITFMECKWKSKESIAESYTLLKEKANLFNTVLNKNYLIFPKIEEKSNRTDDGK